MHWWLYWKTKTPIRLALLKSVNSSKLPFTMIVLCNLFVSKLIKVMFLKRTAVGKTMVARSVLYWYMSLKELKNTVNESPMRSPFHYNTNLLAVKISPDKWIDQESILWSARADFPVNFVIWLVLIFKVFKPALSSKTCNDLIICIILCLIFAVLSEVLTLLQMIAWVRVCFCGSGFLFIKSVKYRSLISPLCAVSAPLTAWPTEGKSINWFSFGHRREVWCTWL